MKKKARKYLIVGIILTLLFIAGVVITYVIATKEPEPVTLSIHKYYDKDGNEIVVGRQQLTIGGVSGVRYIDFAIEVYNSDTVDLDFEITASSPPTLTTALAGEVALGPMLVFAGITKELWISDLVDMLPYEGTTQDFSVGITGSAEDLRRPHTETAVTSILVQPDPFAVFTVTLTEQV